MIFCYYPKHFTNFGNVASKGGYFGKKVLTM